MKKGAKHGRRRRAEAVGESESGSEEVVLEMQIRDVRRGGHDPEGYETVTLVTNRGEVETRYYPAQGRAQGRAGAPSTRAAVFVGGAGGGFDTPVRGWLYPRLCRELQGDGVAALRGRYRRPNDLLEWTLDVLAGGAFLEAQGARSLALVGHSFGGAVVIQAAAVSPRVRACVPMSTQTYGAEPAADLGPRCALLLAHGTADEILPARCSEYVYAIAKQPKELLLKEGARHGLDEWADELPDILRHWIHSRLSESEAAGDAAGGPSAAGG